MCTVAVELGEVHVGVEVEVDELSLHLLDLVEHLGLELKAAERPLLIL